MAMIDLIDAATIVAKTLDSSDPASLTDMVMTVTGATRDEGEATDAVWQSTRQWGDDAPRLDDVVAAVRYRLQARKESDEEEEEDAAIDADPAHNAFMADDQLPPHLHQVPGLVGNLARWINTQNPKDQPDLALCSALACMSALVSKSCRTDRGTKGNVMLVCVAESGAGKDAPLQAPERLLQACGLGERVGAANYSSDTALAKALACNPVCWCADEFGRILSDMTDRGQSWTRRLADLVLQIYGRASSKWQGKAMADSRAACPEIIKPYLTLLGATVPGHLYKALAGGAMDDGLLSRMLFVFGRKRAPLRDMVMAPPPEEVLSEAKLWATVPLKQLGDDHVIPKTDEARVMMNRYAQECDDRYHYSQHASGSLWTRAAQKVEQLSLLYACSKHGAHVTELVIDDESVEWACSFVDVLTERMIGEAASRVAETKSEAAKLEILGLVRVRGADGITKTELCRRTRKMSKREREEALDDLMEGREIISDLITSGRRPKQVYRLRRYS